MWERPSFIADHHLVSRLDLLRLGLEFLNIPICPHEPSVQELCLGLRRPHHEMSWELGYKDELALLS
jgi:hypothetical protein